MNNYWFLYNVLDGAINGAPYLGNAQEWTNIPDGCNAIGPIPEEDATDIIKDAFVNPTHYIIKDGTIVEADNATHLQLIKAQAFKTSEIAHAYNKSLTGGFGSSANGSLVTFDYSETSQTKFMKLLMTMNAGLITYPTTIFAKDSSAVSLTEDQLKQVFKDLTAFEMDLEAKYHALISQINNASTVGEVNAISWS